MRSPVPAAVLLLLATSCSFNLECGAGKGVDRTRVNALVKTLGEKVDTVSAVECPADIGATVGTTFDCTVTFADGARHTAVATITAVKGEDIDVDARWRTPLLGAVQRTTVAKSITAKLGVDVDLYCGGRVVTMTVDQRLRCVVRGAHSDVPVEVWLDDKGDLGWKLLPAEPDAPAGLAPPAEAP